MALSVVQTLEAVAFNRTSRDLLGWRKVEGVIANALGAAANAESLATGIAAFQSGGGLTVDGKLGRVTLSKLRSRFPTIEAAISGKLASRSSSPNAEEYRSLYASLVRDGDKAHQTQAAANRILLGRSRYITAAMRSGVPWHVVGLVHMREASFNFETYLHNGDPLRDAAGNPLKTTHVPKGKLFLTWEESAVDAIREKPRSGLTIHRGDVAAEAEFLERYNGLGYRKQGINSPYLWAATSHYTQGKYVADGVWSPTAVDKQLGCMAVRHFMLERGMLD